MGTELCEECPRLAFDFSAGLIFLIHTPVREGKLPSLLSPCERRLVFVCPTKGSGGEGKPGRVEGSRSAGQQERMRVPACVCRVGKVTHGSGQ